MSSAKATANVNASVDPGVNADALRMPSSSASELAFLVTHWLSNYSPSPADARSGSAADVSASGSADASLVDAVRRIHSAAGQIASAFADLGAFGTVHPPQISASVLERSKRRHATYQDVTRQWGHLVSPRQLEFLAESAASLSRATRTDATATANDTAMSFHDFNVFQRANELRHQTTVAIPVTVDKKSQTNNSAAAAGVGVGRRLGETIDLTTSDNGTTATTHTQTQTTLISLPSILQTIPRFSPHDYESQETACAAGAATNTVIPYKGPNHTNITSTPTWSHTPLLSTVYNWDTIAKTMGDSVRSMLDLRQQVKSLNDEISSLQQAMERHQLIVPTKPTTKQLQPQPQYLLYDTEYADPERVLAQLSQKLFQLTATRAQQTKQFMDAERLARAEFVRGKHLALRFTDPTLQKATSATQTHRAASSWHTGNTLLDRRPTLLLQSTCRTTTRKNNRAMRKTLLQNRLSHAMTISTHLHFPIYCLKFDKTGRYFCTGADDQLVKLFLLGVGSTTSASGTNTLTKRNQLYGIANARGAVLVCTLRGHAGVICDISVSADNSMLATASDDGDVRIWGMKDGCPIAILRGHVGGANMVSWSLLTPYRLVSSGMDGLARIWDVREAALKRYGAHIGDRPEYTLASSSDQIIAPPLNNENAAAASAVLADVALPPLPPPPPPNNDGAPPPLPAVALPPLPPPVQPPPPNNNVAAPAAEGQASSGINTQPGAFVANNDLDEGVTIVARLQHGEVVSRQETAVGTRSRTKTVKVICVARCPLGGHFATGSDDGLCRVWEDEDDERLAMLVDHHRDESQRLGRARRPSSNPAPSTSKLLSTLVGHMSAITDLHYSHAGDRILTASQKDGNARIWSFGASSLAGASSSLSEGNKSLRNLFRTPRQILLRMRKIGGTSQRTSRKRGTSANSSSGAVACDVAVWTSDDSKIVTSQSCPVKSSSQDILPGSQSLLIWDSWTGNCLIAIKQAHQQQCPVIVPHPLEPSIMCSAGADGVAKVWDLDTGRCVLLHRNTLEHGPIAQSNEVGKDVGYLDGSFDPHGHYLLLTDDNGRITIFDCLQIPDKTASPPEVDAWMKDQYFANDYYELFYNSNGYCVERGSEQPPHLAPRAVRCNHSGSPWSEDISDTFRHIKGPSPLSEETAKAERNRIRAHTLHLFGGEDTSQQRAIIMADFDPERTVQINGSEEMVGETTAASARFTAAPRTASFHTVPTGESAHAPSPSTVRRTTSSSGRQLSSNFRWRDYDDIVREEANDAGDVDLDDDEFIPQAAGRTEDDDELSDVMLSESEFRSDQEEDTPTERATRSRRSNGGRSSRSRRRIHRQESRNHERQETAVALNRAPHPTRMSSRRPVAASNESNDDNNDDDAIIEECLSTNNAPTGPFVNDYIADGHLFKLPNATTPVNRAWLSRLESATSYRGKKVYTPQEGDSVVYIPKAHAAMIREFPTLKTPWRKWPSGSRWPIVRCQIRNIRYRFPFKDYFRRRNSDRHEGKCDSIVAILTLEVTGIPELSTDREFPWPKPAFIARQTRSSVQLFEVSVFQSEFAEYVIPESLFLWRLKHLEQALRQRDNKPAGLKLFAYCMPDDGGAEEDPTNEEYEAEIIDYSPTEEDGDDHLNKSGFESVLIEWGTGGGIDISPWEVTIPEEAYKAPNPPTLSSDEKRAVADSLRTIQRNEAFAEFLRPVDSRRYSDYALRVEIPMDLSMMKRRLQQDYYSCILSVVSDVRLIRENCIKYNGPDADIALLASDLVVTFKEEFKKELEKAGIDHGIIDKIDEDTDIVLESEQPSSPVRENGSRTRSAGTTATSSLELLPPPAGHETVEVRPARQSIGGRARPNLAQSVSPVLGRATAAALVSTAAVGESTRSGRHALREGGSDSATRIRIGRHTEVESARPSRSCRAAARASPESTLAADSSRASRSLRLSRPTSYAEEDDEEKEEANYDTREEAKDVEHDATQKGTDRRAASRPFANASSRRQLARIPHDTDDQKDEDVSTKRTLRARNPPQANNADSPSWQSPRKRAATTYADVDSDVDIEDEEEEMVSKTRATKRQSRMEPKPVLESSRRQSARHRVATTSYEEPDSDADVFQDEEEVTPPRRQSARQKLPPSGRSSRRTLPDMPILGEAASTRKGQSVRVPSVRTRTTRQAKASYAEASEESGEETPLTASLRCNAASRTRNVRATRSNRASQPEPDENKDAYADKAPVRGKKRVATKQQSSNKRPRRGLEEEEKSEEAETEEEEDSEEDESEEEDDDDDSVPESEIESEEEKPKRTTAKRVGRTQQPKKRARARASKVMSDEDDSEDFDEEGESEFDSESDDDDDAPKRQDRGRAAKVNSAYPDISVWPSVPIGKITAVGTAVLNEMRLLDAHGVFSVPVVEAIPAIRKVYLKKIKNPMDFRTIEEERLPTYETIMRLQEDLILVFRNCAVYNGHANQFGKFAITLWGQLNDVFERVCQDLGCRLPRGWKQLK